MTADLASRMIRVQVVVAVPESYELVVLCLPAGATVADALAQIKAMNLLAGVEINPDRLAVFSRLVTLDKALHDGDRIEVLRPLLADPKQARRERAGVGKSKKR